MTAPSNESIPGNQRLALLRLKETGLMPERRYQTVLLAVAHSGQPNLALEFAVAAGHLASIMDIDDAVRLRIAEGNPVNLRWSAGRWMEFHSAASRRAALRRLATRDGALQAFPTAWLEARLPAERRRIQVLGTPRRLAKEALRQRHCIATYEDRFRSGAIAGVSLILRNRTRWTATFHRPLGDRPAVLEQARGRRNVFPSRDELEEILELVGSGFTHGTPGSAAERSEEPVRPLRDEEILPRVYGRASILVI